jgi:hypothetical protein
VGEVALAGLGAGDEGLDRVRLGLDYVDNRVESSSACGVRSGQWSTPRDSARERLAWVWCPATVIMGREARCRVGGRRYTMPLLRVDPTPL